MIVCVVILALGALCLTFFLIEKVKAYSLKATIIKSITSFLFILLAAYSIFIKGTEDYGFGAFLLCGLALGLMGDIWLDLKYVFKEQERLFTYAGFICFGVGHIFYVLGMMTTLPYTMYWYSYIIPIAFGLVCGLLVLLLEKPLKYKYGEYKLICFIYATLLFTTVGTAFNLTLINGFNVVPYNMIFIGAILFAISDLILCGTYFGEGKERPFDIISNGITYYAAQYLLAFSLFFIL